MFFEEKSFIAREKRASADLPSIFQSLSKAAPVMESAVVLIFQDLLNPREKKLLEQISLRFSSNRESIHVKLLSVSLEYKTLSLAFAMAVEV